MSEYKLWQPMKYATCKNPVLLKQALESDNYCIQLKKDGSSYIWAKDMDGTVHLYGDKISKKTGKVIDKIENVQHMKEQAEKYFPKGTQVLVEICFGEQSRDVNTIMLALPEKANARQKDNLAKAYVFDILYYNGCALYKDDFAKRWEEGVLRLFAPHCGAHLHDWTVDIPEWLQFAETHYENKGEKLAEWLAAGEEGGVLKMLHSTPKVSAAHHVREIGATPARPMHTTYKIKQVDTVDVVVMDIQMPTSAYTGKDPDSYPYRDKDNNPINRLFALGMANGFVIGAYNSLGSLTQIGTVASGLDDQLRLAAAECPEDYIGQVIEVDCMSKDSEVKSLRHPRLMRFRPDKAAENCLMEEIF